MDEDNFTRARLESRRADNYRYKTSKNYISKEFIDAYITAEFKKTNELEKIASMYMLAEKGINISSYGDIKIEVSEKDIRDIYIKINQNADKNFVLFYQSYLRKIEKGYYPEYVESALQDLKTAYHTLRRTNYFEWNCPDQMITVSEMENLYLLISGEKDNSSKSKEQLK